jgi:hypothetical protein
MRCLRVCLLSLETNLVATLLGLFRQYGVQGSMQLPNRCRAKGVGMLSQQRRGLETLDIGQHASIANVKQMIVRVVRITR